MAKIVIIHFNKITASTTLASAQIVRYLSKKLDAVVLDQYNENFGEGKFWGNKFDVAFLVSSASGFATPEFREQVGEIMAHADIPIFCQNDYVNTIAGQVGKWFDKVGRPRTDIRNWSSVAPWIRKQGDEYINWNMLNMRYSSEGPPAFRPQYDGLLYYGAFRKGRMPYFSRWLSSDRYEVHIGTTERARKSFDSLVPPGPGGLTYHHDIRGTVPETLARFRLGLYLQDERCVKDFCSISCRFYEMISAGLPMVFDPTCISTFERDARVYGGYEIDPLPYIVAGHNDVVGMLANAEQIAREQTICWYRDWRDILDRRFEEIWSGK